AGHAGPGHRRPAARRAAAPAPPPLKSQTRRQGDKETRRKTPSPCLRVSLSPCLRVSPAPHPEPYMRRISFAFAAVFTLVFAAAAGAFHLLHVVQYGRIAASLRWQAERARDDGRTDEAIRYAFQYLEFRPDDVDIMTGLAEWLTDRAKESGNWKHYPAVLNLYEKVLRLTPDDRLTRRK